MIMTNRENINSALEDWREMKLSQIHSEPTEHLPEKVLVRLASVGGLQEASDNELDHLDKCPLCLSSWSAWRRAFTIAEEPENKEENFAEFSVDNTYGFLEAAATTSPKTSGQIVESHCGTYRLEVLPSREEPDEGMIILSSQIEKSDSQVTVRDKNGREIISGALKNGKLARLCQNLNEIDLSVWTIS